MNFRTTRQTHSAIRVPLFFGMGQKSCRGFTRNISFNGVLLNNDASSGARFYNGDVGKCQFYIGDKLFSIQGQVLRRVGNDLAIRFINLSAKQAQSLGEIINTT